MSVTYKPAAEVEGIAEKLIRDCHPHLLTVPIQYLWRDKAATSKGNMVLGKARKLTGLPAHLVHLVRHDEAPEEVEFFVIEIAEDGWKLLDEQQRIALVDHELCHLGIDYPETGDQERKLVIRGHDLEEFAAVVKRHGFWRPDIETFAAAVKAQQDTLFDATRDGDPNADRREDEA